MIQKGCTPTEREGEGAGAETEALRSRVERELMAIQASLTQGKKLLGEPMGACL